MIGRLVPRISMAAFFIVLGLSCFLAAPVALIAPGRVFERMFGFKA